MELSNGWRHAWIQRRERENEREKEKERDVCLLWNHGQHWVPLWRPRRNRIINRSSCLQNTETKQITLGDDLNHSAPFCCPLCCPTCGGSLRRPIIRLRQYRSVHANQNCKRQRISNDDPCISLPIFRLRLQHVLIFIHFECFLNELTFVAKLWQWAGLWRHHTLVLSFSARVITWLRNKCLEEYKYRES